MGKKNSDKSLMQLQMLLSDLLALISIVQLEKNSVQMETTLKWYIFLLFTNIVCLCIGPFQLHCIDEGQYENALLQIYERFATIIFFSLLTSAIINNFPAYILGAICYKLPLFLCRFLFMEFNTCLVPASNWLLTLFVEGA